MWSFSMPSVMSAYLETSRPLHGSDERCDLGKGTGFFVVRGGATFLVTNWHVLTGRDPRSDQPKKCASKPDQVLASLTGVMRRLALPLYGDDNRARWLVHPDRGREYDVAVLPIRPIMPQEVVDLFAYTVDEPADPALLSVTSEVSIVGYPFSLDGRLQHPVWTRGTIATEPDLPFEDTPCFLVDARSREGQSGSPVIAYWRPDAMKGTTAGLSLGHGESWELLGVYSGRITEDSDLARVWKRSAIREIIDGAVREDYHCDPETGL